MKPLEIGLMIWASEAEAKIQTIKQFGLGVAQMGVRYSDINHAAKRRALAKLIRNSGIEWVTLFAAFGGEDYTDVPTVRNTVGLVPPATRAQRGEEAKKLSEFACEVGIKNFAFHVGCVPENHEDPLYQPIVRAVRVVADEARFNGQQFCFETGQESADALLRFIADIKCTNVRVNFDPANMILYGSGDPIEALGKVAEFVTTVHCKDGTGPTAPDKLGQETPLGKGAVGFERFIAKLKEIGYQGPLVIEREISGEQQIADVREGIELLKSLGGVTAHEPPPAPAATPAPSDEQQAAQPPSDATPPMEPTPPQQQPSPTQGPTEG